MADTGNPHTVTLEEARTADDAFAGAVDFAGYKAVAMACDNGTSFPANPTTGQWFYHATIKTLFIYEAAWKGIISFGAVTIYVDKTNGTDQLGNGYASGASAVKTIQYAVNMVSSINGGNVTISCTGEDFAENVTVQGKAFSGSYQLTIQGTDAASAVTGTASGGGSDADTYYMDDATKNWTTNAYRGYFLEITSGIGAGSVRLIESNTSTRLRIVGNLTMNNTSVYKVYIPATYLKSLILAGGQKAIVARHIGFKAGASYNVIVPNVFTELSMYCCRAESGGTIQVPLYVYGYFYGDTCYFDGQDRVVIAGGGLAMCHLDRCIVTQTGGGSSLVNPEFNAWVRLLNGTSVFGSASGHGVLCQLNGSVQLYWGNAVGDRTRIMNNGGYGAYATEAGLITGCSAAYFTGNGSGTYTGVAASYGRAS